MKKSLESLIKKVENGFSGLIYYTDNHINFDDKYFGYKYFIVFQNTHKIYQAYRTQSELTDGLYDMIDNGIRDGSVWWTYNH